LSPPRQSLVREAGIVGGGAPVGALQTLRLLLCYINVEEGVSRFFSLSLHLVMAPIVRGLKLETSRMTPAAFTESNTHTNTFSLSHGHRLPISDLQVDSSRQLDNDRFSSRGSTRPLQVDLMGLHDSSAGSADRSTIRDRRIHPKQRVVLQAEHPKQAADTRYRPPHTTHTSSTAHNSTDLLAERAACQNGAGCSRRKGGRAEFRRVSKRHDKSPLPLPPRSPWRRRGPPHRREAVATIPPRAGARLASGKVSKLCPAFTISATVSFFFPVAKNVYSS
jgi:hypothetical protein